MCNFILSNKLEVKWGCMPPFHWKFTSSTLLLKNQSVQFGFSLCYWVILYSFDTFLLLWISYLPQKVWKSPKHLKDQEHEANAVQHRYNIYVLIDIWIYYFQCWYITTSINTCTSIWTSKFYNGNKIGRTKPKCAIDRRMIKQNIIDITQL